MKKLKGMENSLRSAMLVKFGKSTLVAGGYLYLLFSAQSLFGGSEKITDSYLNELEIRIWTADESQFPDLEQETTRTIQIKPYSSKGHYLLSYLYLKIFGNQPSNLILLKKSSELAQQAIELDEQGDYGYVAIADILDTMGQTDNAIKILETFNRGTTSKSWRVLFGIARLKSDRLPPEDVLKIMEEAMALGRHHWQIMAPYVVAILQTSYRGEPLAKNLKSWQSRYPTRIFQQTLAITLTDLKKFEEAHSIYKQIYRKNPNFKEAHINDAIILYTHLKKPKKALTLLKKVERSHIEDLMPFSKSIVQSYIGAIYLDAGRRKQAINYFIKAAESSPNALKTIEFITQRYRKKNLSADLVQVLNSLNLSLPGQGVFYALLGELHSEDLSNHEEALQAYSNAIILEPQRSDYYNGMGLAYYRMQDINKALSLFSTATQVDPQDAIARYNEACALALLGKSQEAINSLREALLIQPNLSKTAMADDDLKSLNNSTQFKQIISYAESIQKSSNEIKVGH